MTEAISTPISTLSTGMASCSGGREPGTARAAASETGAPALLVAAPAVVRATVSGGCAQIDPKDSTREALLESADQALYEVRRRVPRNHRPLPAEQDMPGRAGQPV